MKRFFYNYLQFLPKQTKIKTQQNLCQSKQDRILAWRVEMGTESYLQSWSCLFAIVSCQEELAFFQSIDEDHTSKNIWEHKLKNRPQSWVERQGGMCLLRVGRGGEYDQYTSYEIFKELIKKSLQGQMETKHSLD